MNVWQAIGKKHELQGLQQGRLEIARKLLDAGVDPKVVSEATGLSRQKLVGLRNK